MSPPCLASYQNMLTIEANVVRDGWMTSSWDRLPGVVQLAIMAKIEEMAPALANAVSSPVSGLFMVPASYFAPMLPQGCTIQGDKMVCEE